MTPELENLLNRLNRNDLPPTEADLRALLEVQGDDLQALYARADEVRRRAVGDAVHLRGIIEFSNYCRRRCNYCGIRAGNAGVQRYRMSPEEIVAQAVHARDWGFGTVVLQSGEDPWFTTDRVCDLLERIKAEAGLAVTLSIGERPAADYARFRAAGCDRYLLRFETSDRELFARIHPDDDYDERLACLEQIRAAGIQVGSGFMIGLPFSGLDVLARDLLFATRLDLDMIGCGPFIAHPDTPLGGHPAWTDREIYFKAIAVLRLMNPLSHIPATTAFDALCPNGRDLVLTRGGNVFMPNITPVAYRAHYQLYPNKPCVDEDGGACARCVVRRLERLKRPPARGRGDSVKRSEARTGEELES
jgi:biotin synthase